MALPKDDLLESFIDAVRASGGSVVVVSAFHPFDLIVQYQGRRHNVRLHIWNVTHGGGPARAADEYRIQPTGVGGEITAPPDGEALLLGWNGPNQVFAAFDPQRHRTVGTSSS